jgi:hypothetical protein
MAQGLRFSPRQRLWGIKLVIGILVMGLAWGTGEIVTYAEEEKRKEEPKQKAEPPAPKPLLMGTVKLVDLDSYTKMRVIRTRGYRQLKLIVEDLPMRSFGMRNYDILLDINSPQEVPASLPEGRYPATLYRRHKEYDEAFNTRFNEVEDNSKPQAIFIDVKAGATTSVRCRAEDFRQIRYEIFVEE